MTDSLASLAAAPAVAPVARSPGYWSNVLRRLRRDPVALAAGAVILALIVMAILAPWISPA
ncbi:MAG: ABC transporter permease, partial [Achromobacter sp.]